MGLGEGIGNWVKMGRAKGGAGLDGGDGAQGQHIEHTIILYITYSVMWQILFIQGGKLRVVPYYITIVFIPRVVLQCYPLLVKIYSSSKACFMALFCPGCDPWDTSTSTVYCFNAKLRR